MALAKVLRRVGLTSVVMIAMVIAGCVSSSEKVPELPPAGNLLDNAGFEQLEDGWAQRWQISSDTDEAKATVSPEAARTGDYGILMKDAVGDEVLTVQQSIKDISADQQYEMTAWVKTTSPVGALRMSVRFYNAGAQLRRVDKFFYSDDEESEFDTDGEWTQIKFLVTADPNTDNAIVYFRSHAPGIVYYDDVSFHLAE